jgi:hypothetical protein
MRAKDVRVGDTITHFCPARGRMKSRMDTLRVRAVRYVNGWVVLETNKYTLWRHPEEGT